MLAPFEMNYRVRSVSFATGRLLCILSRQNNKINSRKTLASIIKTTIEKIK
jgi:hypothetical protein